MIIYHGRDKWNYNKDIRNLIKDYNSLPISIKERLPVLKHDFIDIRDHKEKDIKEYNPLSRMIIRSFKYIFSDKDKLIEAFLVSIEEADKVSDEELYTIVDTILIYYSAANKELSEEDIIKKIRELEGKGEKIMTILEKREQRGMEQGLEQGRMNQLRDSIIEILESKFQMVPDNIKTKINNINNTKDLDVIFKNSLKLDTIKEIEEIIDR